VIYALLAIAILIALMGIANTLSLSIHERTREIGLLRAVGQSRSQVRAMVRWESVLVSTFGAVGGVGVGIFLGWGLVRALNEAEGFGTFVVPAGSLLTIVLLGAAAGVVAGLRPAWRASRLDVLQAVSAD
jgi:putative ABC transport system permease protein